MYALTIFP